jgi:hypothetical protein
MEQSPSLVEHMLVVVHKLVHKPMVVVVHKLVVVVVYTDFLSMIP